MVTLPNVQKTFCVPLSKIIEIAKVSHINVFILDVEGGELAVLNTIHWDTIQFDVIIVETERKFRPEHYAENVIQFLVSKGYQFLFEKFRNSWFKHPSFVPSSRETYPKNVSQSSGIDSLFDHLPLLHEIQITSEPSHNTNKSGRNIPKIVWIASYHKPKIKPNHIVDLETKNPDWKINLVGKDDIYSFMEQHFKNTSLLYAFNLINPVLKAAIIDVWRQAVLYIHGGVYLDFDVVCHRPFDEFIFENDTIILGQEKGHMYSNLYRDDFILSKSQNISREIFPLFTTVIQWMIIVEPRNIFIKNTLANIVKMIKLEYIGNLPVIDIMKPEYEMRLFLTTGPMIFTASILEVLYHYPNTSFRVYKTANFQEIGVLHRQRKSYRKLIEQNKHKLLRQYISL